MSRPDAARRYWDAYRASLEPPHGAAARTLARLEERIAAGEEVRLGSSSSRAPRRAAAGVVLWGKATAVSVGLGVTILLAVKVAVVAWSAWSGGTEPAGDRIEHVDEAARAERAPKGRAAASPEAPAPAAIVADDASEPTSTATPSPSQPSQPSPPSPTLPASKPGPSSASDVLRAELALMDRARTALERDDASALWQRLDEHERRFPAGALVEERDAWRAVAACRLGHADALTRARRFLREHPRSAQAARVERECIPPSANRVTERPGSAG